MLITKSRLQGSSVVVTLPPHNGEKLETNKEYIVVYSPDGTITLVPKIEDPFVLSEAGAFYEKDEWDNVSPEGRELF